jgi:hypothetical protein
MTCSPFRLTNENAPVVLHRLGYKSRWGLWYHPEVDKRPTVIWAVRLWFKRRRDRKTANAELSGGEAVRSDDLLDFPKLNGR